MNELCTYADDECENMISNICSRGISTMLMVQSESQLVAGYGESAARRSNKPVHEILNMPIDTCWLFRVGEKPQMVDFVDIDAFQAQKKFIPFAEMSDAQEGLDM